MINVYWHDLTLSSVESISTSLLVLFHNKIKLSESVLVLQGLETVLQTSSTSFCLKQSHQQLLFQNWSLGRAHFRKKHDHPVTRPTSSVTSTSGLVCDVSNARMRALWSVQNKMQVPSRSCWQTACKAVCLCVCVCACPCLWKNGADGRKAWRARMASPWCEDRLTWWTI